MADNFNDFYIDCVSKVGSELEKERCFQYLFEMIRSGDNEIHQTNQRLHKVVDETWIATIEDALDSLTKVTDNPRKFLKTEENVVPVGLAKKITADSVRHLSQNTQFLSGDDPDKIQPTKIMNVSLDETYDLYENRFIYHLINRLVRFIDKRTDVIFWSTGDEIQNKLEFNSHIDDAYERIDYKVEMTVKNLRSFAENDSDNMDTFMRIDRVRRMVMGLRASSFCEVMQGCQVVRSPIQRTNLLTKDPDYRKCYQLWQFLERYDDVGYTIEVRDSAGAFDQEYVNQLYTNLITQYATFKGITGGEERDFADGELQKMLESKDRKIVPKFNTEIIEEEVTDRNLPDVEIRRVFVEEVTQAQLDAEAKAEEAIKAKEAAEASQKEAEKAMRRAVHEAEDAKIKAEDANNFADAMKKRAEESDAEKAEAIAKCAEDIKAANEAAEAKVKEAQESYQQRADAAEAQIKVVEADYLKKADEANAAADARVAEANKQRELAEEKVEKSRKAREDAEAQIRTKEYERSQAEAARKETQALNEELQKKVEIANRLKESAESKAQKEVYEMQARVNSVESDLKVERDIVKRTKEEKEAALKEARNAVSMAEKAMAERDEILRMYEESFSGKLRRFFRGKDDKEDKTEKTDED